MPSKGQAFVGQELLGNYQRPQLEKHLEEELIDMVSGLAKEAGMEKLPEINI